MGRKVLVVDDEKLIVKGIRFSLLQDDYEVDCAYDGEEALEMARRKEYDMILDFVSAGAAACVLLRIALILAFTSRMLKGFVI